MLLQDCWQRMRLLPMLIAGARLVGDRKHSGHGRNADLAVQQRLQVMDTGPSLRGGRSGCKGFWQGLWCGHDGDLEERRRILRRIFTATAISNVAVAQLRPH